MRCYSSCLLWLSLGFLQPTTVESSTQAKKFIPEVALGIRQLDSQDGKLIGVVEPKITWRTNGKLNEYDVEGGMEVIAQDRSLTLWPSTVWAKVQRALRFKDQNYNVAARLQAHAVTEQVDLQVTANLDDATWVRLQAVTSPDTFSHSPTLSTTFFHEQSLKPWGKQGSLWVRPNLQVSQKSQPQGQIQIRYQRPDVNNNNNNTSSGTDANTNDNVKSTTFQVDAWSGDGRAQRRPGLKCTVSRFLDAYNLQLSPFVTTTRGVVGIHVEREFPDCGRLYATIQPTESIDVTWQEGSWTARLEAPLFAKGGGANNNNKIRMSLHRSLDLLI